jgi:UDP-N-acetyl-D-mannosaminuronate dehydrogenase
VLVNDPLFEPDELRMLDAEVVELDSDSARHVDAVVVQAFHQQYRDLDWSQFDRLKVILDGRGSLDPERVRKTKARYLAVGLPG